MGFTKVGNIAIFRNEEKKNDKQPDYKGNAKFDSGDVYLISVWLRKTKEGKTYMSGTLSIQDGDNLTPSDKPTTKEDDDIPF